MKLSLPLTAAVLFGAALSAPAQQAAPAPVYRVQFELQPDSGTKNLPTRHFTMLVQQSRTGILQAIDTMPVETGGAPATVDVGATIECSVKESEGKFQLHANLEVSRIAGMVNTGGIAQPIVAQKKLSINKTVEPGAATQVTDVLSATVTKVD